MSTTIRISDEAKQRLAALSEETGRAMTDLIQEAIDALDRKLFFEQFNRRYAELRADPEAWAEIEAERRIEEGAIRDGLD